MVYIAPMVRSASTFAGGFNTLWPFLLDAVFGMEIESRFPFLLLCVCVYMMGIGVR